MVAGRIGGVEKVFVGTLYAMNILLTGSDKLLNLQKNIGFKYNDNGNGYTGNNDLNVIFTCKETKG